MGLFALNFKIKHEMLVKFYYSGAGIESNEILDREREEKSYKTNNCSIKIIKINNKNKLKYKLLISIWSFYYNKVVNNIFI